jgi:hypothetical protein
MDMLQNKHEYSKYAKRAVVTALVLVLGVLLLCGFGDSRASGAPGKEKDEQLTRVYTHTYDEVFQASQETIERLGLTVVNTDKDKGTISGDGQYRMRIGDFAKVNVQEHIETISAKPEVRVTLVLKIKAPPLEGGMARNNFVPDFFNELQKVLATYH